LPAQVIFIDFAVNLREIRGIIFALFSSSDGDRWSNQVNDSIVDEEMPADLNLRRQLTIINR